MDRHEYGEERSGSAAQAAEWDARHSERDGARWSGQPNWQLLAEVADLAPGRALDVGCGEGRARQAAELAALPSSGCSMKMTSRQRPRATGRLAS